MYSALAGACKYSMRKGADNSNRDLRLGEVLTICEFLGVDPMEFADKEEEKVEGRWKEITGYGIRIEVKNGEIEKIFEELNNAQEKIYDCYNKLQNLGVLVISGTEDNAPEG